MTDLKDRIIGDLWIKYNRSKSDYGIVNSEIRSYTNSLESRIKDRDKAHYWVNFYKVELEKLGEDVSEE
ncbi:MAG: hypothetical protein ACYTDW_21855 [Planctomycetota bacterium]|jgi:hypothetical protein